MTTQTSSQPIQKKPRAHSINAEPMALKSGHRRQRQCPYCHLKVVTLSRHIQRIHPERTHESPRKPFSSRFTTKVRCPISRCGKEIKRVDRHLLETHQIAPKSYELQLIIEKLNMRVGIKNILYFI